MHLRGFSQSINAGFELLCESYANSDGGVLQSHNKCILGDKSAYYKSGISTQIFGIATLPTGKVDRCELLDEKINLLNHTAK